MNCPSSEDFVMYNGLRPARSQWSAPRLRTLSRTKDFDPLGLNDQTARQSIDNKTNDTSKVAPMMKLTPKDQLLLVVQRSDCNTVRWKWSNLPEGFEEFWVDALVYRRCDDGEFAFEDAQSKHNDELSEERGSLMKDTRCGSFVFGSLWATQVFSSSPSGEKEELGFEVYRPLGRYSNARQTRWVGFSAESTVSRELSPWWRAHCCTWGRKLVLRANAKRFSWPIVHRGGYSLVVTRGVYMPIYIVTECTHSQRRPL